MEAEHRDGKLPVMNDIVRAELVERIRLLDQASRDFPGTDVVLKCHHLISDVADYIGTDEGMRAELARATKAAAERNVGMVCAILSAVLTQYA